MGKWPCAICDKDVCSNSTQCTVNGGCERCSGVNGSLHSFFVCNMCFCPTDSAQTPYSALSCVEIGDSPSTEIMDGFCYLGVMLSVSQMLMLL